MVANRYVRLFLKLILLIVGIGVVCGALFLLYDIVSGSWVPDSSADITYAVKTASGSSWYEIADGRIIMHPPLPGVSITGIVRGGDKTFILGTSGTSSTLYQYDAAKKTYTTIYSAQKILGDLAIDQDGLNVAFTAENPNYSTPDLDLLPLNSGAVMQIGSGYSPAFLGSSQTSSMVNGKPFIAQDGYLGLVYVHGPNVDEVTLYKNSMSSTTAAYTSARPFGINTRLASDSKTLFGFTDPASLAVDVWDTTQLSPFAASPRSSEQNQSTSILGFTNGLLTSIVLVPASQGKSKTVTSAQVSIFPNEPKASPATVLIPLTAAGTATPIFIGIISS